jgi:hypothetical protein
MANTTRGMLENFFELIDQFGFVPSAGNEKKIIKNDVTKIAIRSCLLHDAFTAAIVGIDGVGILQSHR